MSTTAAQTSEATTTTYEPTTTVEATTDATSTTATPALTYDDLSPVLLLLIAMSSIVTDGDSQVSTEQLSIAQKWVDALKVCRDKLYAKVSVYFQPSLLGKSRDEILEYFSSSPTAAAQEAEQLLAASQNAVGSSTTSSASSKSGSLSPGSITGIVIGGAAILVILLMVSSSYMGDNSFPGRVMKRMRPMRRRTPSKAAAVPRAPAVAARRIKY